MIYSSIAYFQCVMTGESVKREIGVWSWQDARPDPPHSDIGVKLKGSNLDFGHWWAKFIIYYLLNRLLCLGRCE
ncbi:hypothetical protein CSC79_14185 [Pseudoalteromonas sp. 3D05]|nr:hypothetical protein CSC79_14185 [Pseudoalteromonas sp. 3D05]